MRSLGHDVVRVWDILPVTSSDEAIVDRAKMEQRTILTQDLDFTNIIALSGEVGPSLITLRLASSRIEWVNKRLSQVLPLLEGKVNTGLLLTITDDSVRSKKLPIE